MTYPNYPKGPLSDRESEKMPAWSIMQQRAMFRSALIDYEHQATWEMLATLWPRLPTISYRWAGYVGDVLPTADGTKSVLHAGVQDGLLRVRSLFDRGGCNDADRGYMVAFLAGLFGTVEDVACARAIRVSDPNDVWRPMDGPYILWRGQSQPAPTVETSKLVSAKLVADTQLVMAEHCFDRLARPFANHYWAQFSPAA
ncbi:hypothetical protein RM531_08760 [Salinisphaera sp. P385]|uniref:Uncharacterized protein n=1 Tax=Spectribacter acetivorans TaxID=3075603 RepID=A0ABU3BBD2_9GAMM|nr:hypothetical protein [Salinisphaera sp. P385]MDT0618568.1 hypothetical protein [Salinisphaera sp. P385]